MDITVYDLYNTGETCTINGFVFTQNAAIEVFNVNDLINCKLMEVTELVKTSSEFAQKMLSGQFVFRKDEATQTKEEFYKFIFNEVDEFIKVNLCENSIIDAMANNRLIIRRNDGSKSIINYT